MPQATPVPAVVIPDECWHDAGHRNVITLAGLTADHPLENDDSFKGDRLKEYAKDFAGRLYKAGILDH